MIEVIRIARPVGFAVFSVAIHLVVAASCGLFSPAGPRSVVPNRELIDITLEPALGRANGVAQGKGLGSRIAQGQHRSPTARVIPAAHEPVVNDPAAIPTSTATAANPKAQAIASSALPVSTVPQPGLGSAATPAGDPASPTGSANVPAGIGRPDGTEGGVGMGPPKARMTPQYKGMLAGWFASRFSTRGLGLPFEELKKLRVRATVSLSAGRQVVSFSVGSSGNGAFDEKVRQTLGQIQASGLSLPAPPDDSVLPPSFPVSFQCTDERRCL